MEFLLYLGPGLIHSAVLTLATILLLESYGKFFQLIFSFNSINLALEQQNSTLIKKKTLVIQQAFEDAGLKHTILINYLGLKLHPLHLVTRKRFEHCYFSDKETYLLTENNYNSPTAQSSWELQWKSNNQWQKEYLSFEVDGKPYAGELTPQHIAYIKDNLLLRENKSEDFAIGVAVIPFEDKVIIQTTGGILKLPDNQLYAIACHEAMHIKYYHIQITNVALLESLYLSYKLSHYVLDFLPPFVAVPSAILLSFFFMVKVYFPYVDSALSRQLEKSADIRASIEMGVASDLSEYKNAEEAKASSRTDSHLTTQIQKEAKVSSRTSSHPTTHERISYMSKYLNINSLFTNPGLSERLKQEEKKNYPEGERLTLIYRKTC